MHLKPLYSRLDRLAQRQGSPFSTEAQQEHVKIIIFKMSYILSKKRSGLKNIGLIYYTDFGVDHCFSGDNLKIMLIDFYSM